MLLKRYFWLGLLLWVQVGCADKKAAEPVVSSSTATTQEPIENTPVDSATSVPEQEKVVASLEPQKPSVEVDVINGYLDEFRGCACYFARNEQELKQEKFIYFNDYQQKALVSISGTRISLIGVAKGNPSTLNSPYTDPKGRYEVTVSIQDSKQTGDEVAFKKGTLQIKDLKTGATQTVPFVGECGC